MAADPLAPDDWLAEQLGLGDERPQPEERAFTGRELLLGTSFHLVSNPDEGRRGPAL